MKTVKLDTWVIKGLNPQQKYNKAGIENYCNYISNTLITKNSNSDDTYWITSAQQIFFDNLYLILLISYLKKEEKINLNWVLHLEEDDIKTITQKIIRLGFKRKLENKENTLNILEFIPTENKIKLSQLPSETQMVIKTTLKTITTTQNKINIAGIWYNWKGETIENPQNVST